MQADHWINLRKRQCGGSDSDAIAFSRLQSDLDERYIQTDAVFHSSCCADTDSEIQDARVKMHASRGMYVEFFDAKIVPFGALESGSAMWKGLQSREIALTDGVYRVSGSLSSDDHNYCLRNQLKLFAGHKLIRRHTLVKTLHPVHSSAD